MDDIELLKLENKALREKTFWLEEQLKITTRALKLIRRSSEIAQGVGKIEADELLIAQSILGA